MSKKKRKAKRRLKRFEKFQSESAKQRHYSIQRFDLLIIAIGTTGIVIGLNILKFFHESADSFPDGGYVLLKIASGVFTFSIVVNFISQLTSHRAFLKDEYWAQQNVFKIEKDKDFDETKMKRYGTVATRWHRFTKICNRLATFTIIVGIVLLSLTVILFL